MTVRDCNQRPTELTMQEHMRSRVSNIANSGPGSIWKVVDQSNWPVALIRNKAAFGRKPRWRIYFMKSEAERQVNYTTAEEALTAVRAEICLSRGGPSA
jgi:hypothetical protein